MKAAPSLRYRLIAAVALLVLTIVANIAFSIYVNAVSAASHALVNKGVVTVRVNTFRRPLLLKEFLDSHHACSVVKQIQVVWSDTENKPSLELQGQYPEGRVVFEMHGNNSLNNRFKPMLEVSTDAVLSIDDDLVIPCDVLERAYMVWSSNTRALVGFSPRIATFDAVSGATVYGRWQHTWWNGLYNIVLTKAALFSSRYLYEYNKRVPQNLLDYVDKSRNCEDIVMAHIVAERSQAPPVWVDGSVFEIGKSGISSGGRAHFSRRGDCLRKAADALGSWPWVFARQKSVQLSLANAFNIAKGRGKM